MNMGIPPRLSKFITTFSVLLIIVSIILPSLVSVQPSTQGNIALLSITSSAINGPTVVFGLLGENRCTLFIYRNLLISGSCGRSSPVEPFSCTPKKVSPQYSRASQYSIQAAKLSSLFRSLIFAPKRGESGAYRPSWCFFCMDLDGHCMYDYIPWTVRWDFYTDSTEESLGGTHDYTSWMDKRHRR